MLIWLAKSHIVSSLEIGGTQATSLAYFNSYCSRKHFRFADLMCFTSENDCNTLLSIYHLIRYFWFLFQIFFFLLVPHNFFFLQRIIFFFEIIFTNQSNISQCNRINRCEKIGDVNDGIGVENQSSSKAYEPMVISFTSSFFYIIFSLFRYYYFFFGFVLKTIQMHWFITGGTVSLIVNWVCEKNKWKKHTLRFPLILDAENYIRNKLKSTINGSKFFSLFSRLAFFPLLIHCSTRGSVALFRERVVKSLDFYTPDAQFSSQNYSFYSWNKQF